ncbi:MAG: NAD(P)H-dependent oxidoreductase [Patescibacteria group bacterium]|nr:NAD(P)H-dependent oxidoreductase [Patescibacteria group bacterium]MCL5431826.1 NAD(P)H-dependent oxidoreductase [Patescibacteria group bacterium]
MEKVKIFGFGGSLRAGSFSKALLYAAKELAPAQAELEIFENLGAIPVFNQDQEKTPPAVVVDFKKKIKAADAILISTPEYNFSLPGFLKNAIDWASRPYGDNSFDDKPAAIMSASGSFMGGVKAQYALRQAMVFLNMHPLNKPEVIVPDAMDKIKDGQVTDPHTREKIKELLDTLVIWTKRLK